MFTEEIKQAINKCILCWLATVGEDGEPNVSPKEMFTYLNDETFLLAHIASPQSVRNLRQNPRVCISFADIFTQKGFKLKGQARLIEKNAPDFAQKLSIITDRFTDRFPVQALIEVKVDKVARILAPSYVFFPEVTTEAGQVAGALQAYGVKAQ